MKTSQWMKIAYLGLAAALLSACGSQESANTDIAIVNNNSKATKSVAIESVNTLVSNSSLLTSLAQLYPNGQLPAERVAQAAQELNQNPTALLLTSAAPSATASKIKQQSDRKSVV